MKYVLDASVGVKWVLPELDSDIALRIRAEFEKQAHELLSPDVFPAECGHALARAERKNIIPPGATITHIADIATSLPELHSSSPLLTRAAQLASQMRISFYDCLYVALAEQEQCAVLTADEKLERVFKGHTVVLLSALR